MKNPLDHRAKPAKRSDQTPGAAPGLLVAPEGSPTPRLDVLLSGNGGCEIHRNVSLDILRELRAGQAADQWLWLDVNGLGDAAVIADIGALFGLHRLALEDSMNLHQHPRMAEYEDALFTVLQVPGWMEEGLEFEQVSLFLGDRWLVSLQAEEASQLEGIYSRFQKGAPRMSQSGADYLFYVALDLLVDQVFPVLEEMEELADQTEDALLDASGSIDMGGLHRLRRDASVLRRVLWNQSLVPDQFLRLEHNRLDPQTRPYLQDVRDHAQRGLARAEQVRDDCIALFDLHRSLANDRLNEVLRVLTVISTVFMPLTFIVGVYGMNFDPHAGRWNMPELAWKYGYPAVWALMLAVAVGMWGLFRRRGWIGRGGKSE